MIGTSPKSDINPALAAGLNAVFVPHAHAWVLEKQGDRRIGEGKAVGGGAVWEFAGVVLSWGGLGACAGGACHGMGLSTYPEADLPGSIRGWVANTFRPWSAPGLAFGSWRAYDPQQVRRGAERGMSGADREGVRWPGAIGCAAGG
jgi:hypothetical protein